MSHEFLIQRVLFLYISVKNVCDSKETEEDIIVLQEKHQIINSLVLSLFSVVQSLNSPFFPPHIGAEPGRAG